MTAINDQPLTESTETRPRHCRRLLRRSAFCAALVVAAVGLAACGGDDSPGASAEGLATVSDCIADAGVTVAPTSLSQSFMDEHGIVGALDLGPRGSDVGGGELLFFESSGKADSYFIDLTGTGTAAALRQKDAVVLEYESDVASEVAELVMGCAG